MEQREDDEVSRRTPDLPRLILRAMRPRQWPKNLLVAAAPLASGQLAVPAVALRTSAAMAVFVAASSAVYLLNDVIDREHDASHPIKRDRPVASGRIRPGAAGAASALLGVAAVASALAVAGSALAGLVLAYLVVSVAYSLGLKHRPLVDIVIVASGFLLRALAGGAATGIPVSTLFLVTATAGALFVATGKRASELVAVTADGSTVGATRPSLVHYSSEYLRSVWTMMAAVALVGAALWAVEVAGGAARPGLARASIAPFALVLLRYAWWIERGEAEAPEDVVRRDRVLAACVVAWAVLLGLGVGMGV